MEHSIQCPQCGAANAVKTSATMYHCTYCESNFEVKPSKQDIIEEILEKQKASATMAQANLQQTYAQINQQTVAAARRGVRGVTSGVVIAMLIVGLSVFYNLRAKHSLSSSISGGDWEDPSINKCVFFAGSKGPVAWMIEEQSTTKLDSARYSLKIVNASNGSTLKEFLFIPAMTWSDGFNADKSIGDFYAFGDTCWQFSENNGLVARDIYSGDVIVDQKGLAKMCPKLSAGISKANFRDYDRSFEVTTADGFTYIFNPGLKQTFTSDEWEKKCDEKNLTKTFFTISEATRPQLFVSKERSSKYYFQSKIFSNELDDFKPGERPDMLSDDVISLNEILPDKAFFNGNVVYSDNNKSLILYQIGMAKNSALHAACISADGKQLWDVSGDDLKDFQDSFSESNSIVNFVYSKDAAVIYEQSSVDEGIALNWSNGKVMWKYSTKDKTGN